MKGWIELTTVPREEGQTEGHKMIVLLSEIVGVEKAGTGAYIVLRNRLNQPVQTSYEKIIDMIKKIK